MPRRLTRQEIDFLADRELLQHGLDVNVCHGYGGIEDRHWPLEKQQKKQEQTSSIAGIQQEDRTKIKGKRREEAVPWSTPRPHIYGCVWTSGVPDRLSHQGHN